MFTAISNRVDPAAEGLDYAIRCATVGPALIPMRNIYASALMSPLCSPTLATQIQTPADILKFPLLRSYRRDESGALDARAAGGATPSPTLQCDGV